MNWLIVSIIFTLIFLFAFAFGKVVKDSIKSFWYEYDDDYEKELNEEEEMRKEEEI